MARSTFYYHFRKSKQPDKYAREKESIIRLYHEHKGRYGYRRITVEMNKIGYAINHKTVLKLMNICGIKSQVRLRKYCSYKGQIGRIAPNLLQRDFAAEKPNQKWVTDLTEFSVCGVKLYLSPIMDLYNREIISYKIAERPNFMQIMKMLDVCQNTGFSGYCLAFRPGLAVSDEAVSAPFKTERYYTEHVAQG